MINKTIIERCREDFSKWGTLSTPYIQRKYKVSFKEAENIKKLVLGDSDEVVGSIDIE